MRTGIDPDFKHTLWETDVQLVEAVQRADYCICYLSAQREPDSPDWFNIVLLHDAAGVDLWNQGDLHQFCVRYYDVTLLKKPRASNAAVHTNITWLSKHWCNTTMPMYIRCRSHKLLITSVAHNRRQ